MKLLVIKFILLNLENVEFQFFDGFFVFVYFYVMEVGSVQKYFIDCGGIVCKENVVNFQLWNVNDFEYCLKFGKFLCIIQFLEDQLGIEDEEIEVEY